MAMRRRFQLLYPTNDRRSMETAVKVAFASTDMKRVDQHFGVAESFVIYAVDTHHRTLLEVVQFRTEGMDGDEGKLAPKIAALEGCVAVYAQAAGASAVAQLKKQGIQPVKVPANARVSDVLGSLQDELREGPSAPWLARAIRANQGIDADRFSQMEAEGWKEHGP